MLRNFFISKIKENCGKIVVDPSFLGNIHNNSVVFAQGICFLDKNYAVYQERNI